MTEAPFLAAYLIPSAIETGSRAVIAGFASSGSPLSRVTRTERILAAGATPMMPSLLPGPCPCPAMRLAISVPLNAEERAARGAAGAAEVWAR